ncbi:ribose-5-phosphate isomerase RpiA [Zavarzinella formosa]|uniref:ribose-5-phosphate isomerase RpiA n=1 Tax=Zavarzinella formosa TaxID=360055 RepID=UPI00035C8863|nr:ribose-5-phosphate isomerase RpiA [Zavarzinella formosa]
MAANTNELNALAAKALDFISEGAVVGLGTGRAATVFLHVLGEKVRAGFPIRGVPTSLESERLACELGIPLTSLDEVDSIDVDVDGADEADPAGNLIKGYGGALLREKIVAAASRRVVILVGEEKLVPVLGSRGVLPVEVIPFGKGACARQLTSLGLNPRPRMREGQLMLTDNGNHILDCDTPTISQPEQLEAAIRAIPGVVGTGLFLGMNPTVLIGSSAGVIVRGPVG